MSRLPFVLAFLLLFSAGCGRQERKEVKLFEPGSGVPEIIQEDERSFRVGIAAVLSPKEMFVYYNNLLDYLGEKLSKPVVIRHGHYERINDLLRDGELDLAFICSGAYAAAHKEFGLRVLAVPVMDGKSEYYSYIIVPSDSGVSDFSELEGKSFSFVDPLSNSGYFYPVRLLKENDKSPTAFFSRILFTNSHDNSIMAVAERLVDGAAVNSLVYDMLAAANPRLVERTKIIRISPPYGIPPVVVPPGADGNLIEEFEEFFLNLHEDETGLRILRDLRIDKFIKPAAGLYDSILLPEP